MLSRSSSNAAGDRLRRAKSNSSAHTASSSSHQRTSTSIDPFITRQQAEAAAVEAYHRANPYQDPQLQPYRPVPPKLQRRRSQVTGKTEGSHFEDARLGRRRSNSRREDDSGVKTSRIQQRQTADSSDDHDGERVITRSRSVIPPDPNAQLSSSEGSPVRRNTSALKERKSFILAPLQKSRATNANNSSDGSSYGINHAEEILPPPAITVRAEQKPRNFTSSLKGRVKNIFRKSSRTTGLPLQHVEGKSYCFSTTSPLSTPVIDAAKDEDPFTTATHDACLAVSGGKADSASGRRSAGGQSEARSRVTSWADSTVAGTCSTRHDSGSAQTADEQGQLKRSGSMSTLRKASSFLGRPIKTKLRKASKAELRTTDESAGLYSALQERIKPMESTSEIPSKEPDAQSTTPSAIATLPSQQSARLSVSSNMSWSAPTIRSATPDPGAYKLDIPSPVTEVLSPDIEQPCAVGHVQRGSEHSASVQQNRPQRRLVTKASIPSKDRLAQRMEMSTKRWQGPLDEMSPVAPRSTRATMMDENPYEPRSLSRSLQQPVVTNDLPRHTRIGDAPVTTRHDVLSPSLYSRGTDGESPRPDTPVDLGGTMVTITGREVRSYSISPPKRRTQPQQPSQGSQDWRRWLSDEMHGWDRSTAREDFALPKSILKNAEPGRVPIEDVQDTPEFENGSTPPVYGTPSVEAYIQRPRIKNRRSSYMNERYPMIDSTGDTVDSKATLPNVGVTGKASKRPKSSLDLYANYKSKTVEKGRPIEVRRKSHHRGGSVDILEDTTILNISAGPYASQPAVAMLADGIDKENAPPAELNALVRSHAMDSDTCRGSSPGQRLATSWLGGKSKENSPAFV